MYVYVYSYVSECCPGIIAVKFQGYDRINKVLKRGKLTIVLVYCIVFLMCEALCVSFFKESGKLIMQFPKFPSVSENESPVPDNEVERGEI